MLDASSFKNHEKGFGWEVWFVTMGYLLCTSLPGSEVSICGRPRSQKGGGSITYCARNILSNSGDPETAGGVTLYFNLAFPTCKAK